MTYQNIYIVFQRLQNKYSKCHANWMGWIADMNCGLMNIITPIHNGYDNIDELFFCDYTIQMMTTPLYVMI